MTHSSLAARAAFGDSDSTPKTTVYLVRHATPVSHLENGHLTESGLVEAKKLAKRFADLDKYLRTIVVASPTLRTRETAEQICVSLGLRPIFYSAFAEEYLIDKRKSFLSPAFLAHHVAASKILRAFWHVVKYNRGKRIIIVTHGNVIRVLIGKLLGLSFDAMSRVKVDCASVTAFEIDVEKKEVELIRDC